MSREYDRNWRYDMQRQHVVNNPIIFNDDIDIQRRMFWEAAISTGITVDFYNCCSDISDFYQDPNLKWEKPVLLPVIFDDHPKVKILKDYGWFTEDEEDRPQLVYLPMYKDWTTKELLKLNDNSLIRVHYFGQNFASEFRITDKRMDSLYGVYWVCKLAPERINVFNFIDEHGEHFLKRARRDEPDKMVGDKRVYENDQYVKNIIESDNEDTYYDMIMNGKDENTVDKYKYDEDIDVVDLHNNQQGEGN